MNRFCTFALAMLAGTLAWSAPADGDVARHGTRPPVLQPSEPSDSVLVMLPGRRARMSASVGAPPAAATVGVRSEAKSPAPGPVASAYRKPVMPDTADPRPVIRRAPKPVFPSDFEKDSAVFCQKRIGQWTKPDAYNLLGDPIRQRPSYSEKKTVNGTIYAFSDPTGHYRALELDFANTGILRTVYVYPWSMTWLECRRLWGGRFTSTEANKGRTFYSYMNRHLDVLVEAGGKVVSLGLY